MALACGNIWCRATAERERMLLAITFTTLATTAGAVKLRAPTTEG